MCLSRHWDGFPLGLGLVVEDKPTELSFNTAYDGTTSTTGMSWVRELTTDQAYFCYSFRLVTVVFDVLKGTKVGGCEVREKMSVIIGHCSTSGCRSKRKCQLPCPRQAFLAMTGSGPGQYVHLPCLRHSLHLAISGNKCE